MGSASEFYSYNTAPNHLSHIENCTIQLKAFTKNLDHIKDIDLDNTTYNSLTTPTYCYDSISNDSMYNYREIQSPKDECSTQSSDGLDNLESPLAFSDTKSNFKFLHLHHCSYSTCLTNNIPNMVQPIMNEPTFIEHGKLKFLILDAPSNNNISNYVKEMKSYGITDLVRTNYSTYDTSLFSEANIKIHDLFFEDGSAPPVSIILNWMEIVRSTSNYNGAIAVHCVAGLGRAPVLVSIALIENGMEPLNAINYIRKRRRGAINRTQLQFLQNYKSPCSKKIPCIQRCIIS